MRAKGLAMRATDNLLTHSPESLLSFRVRVEISCLLSTHSPESFRVRVEISCLLICSLTHLNRLCHLGLELRFSQTDVGHSLTHQTVSELELRYGR